MGTSVLHRRAVEAAIWGVPIVRFYALRQACFRDAHASYNDVIWWPHGADWRSQNLTPNTVARYIFFFGNLDQDGPVVFELPGGVPGAAFLGTFSDAWWEPLSDLGVAWPDEGNGGKYLVLPAGHDGEVPSGHIPVRSRTSNYFMGLRSILQGQTAENVRAGNALVEQIRVYPLSEAASPPAQRLIDMTGVMFEALPRYDATFYTTLARILNEEPVQERDKTMMGLLLAFGIKRGQEFEPTAELTAELDHAAREANTWFIDGLVRTSQTYWPDRRWVFPMPAIAAPERPDTPHWAPQFKWEVDDYFDADSRAIALASFFCPPVKLGLSSTTWAPSTTPTATRSTATTPTGSTCPPTSRSSISGR